MSNRSISIPEELAKILRQTPVLANAYLVGGCVRDGLLGRPQKDFDIEVFDVDYDELVDGLAQWGRADRVGRSFGVVKLTTGSGCQFDFTLPRRDSKTGPGHRGFAIEFSADITPREAASRRDFTLNALMLNPRSGEVLDFFGGVDDLRLGILRHVGDAFVEDPLRVLRGMQFAARFQLVGAPDTIALCRTIRSAYRELAVERVREEWFKWAAYAVKPSAGLQFLAATGWMEHFPEVLALMDCPQDPEWHPEGDVFVHTCHCCDAMATLPEWLELDVESRTVLMLAILAHDFAKPSTTQKVERDGRIRVISPGHEEAGGPLAAEFLDRLQSPHAVRERVVPLVMNHLAHLQAGGDRAIRRLARRLAPETIEHLCILITADQFGRPPRPREISENLLNLRVRAGELHLQAAAPRPILQGRHLIALGLSPGAEFGQVLNAAFDAQIEGAFADLDEGMRWLEANSRLPLSREQFAAARRSLGLEV